MSEFHFTKLALEFQPFRGSTPEYLIHQLVHGVFGAGDREREFLYRVVSQTEGSAEVLAYSLVPPATVEELEPVEYGRVVSVQTKLFTPIFREGQALDFSLRVNATCSSNQQRLDLWQAKAPLIEGDPEEAMDEVYGTWLRGKLDDSVDIRHVQVANRNTIRPVRRGFKHRNITLVASDLIGSLVVKNPEGLRSVIRSGIGRGKAFGCGMLCLSPAGTLFPTEAFADA